MKFFKLICTIFLIFSSTISFSSDLGNTGLIDTPTARMMEDGYLKGSFSTQKIANITNLTYQATPWLETTFRYTVFNPDNKKDRYNPNIDGLNDRSYGVKIRLRKESKFLPQIAIGMQDILGTGAWSAEYLVSSKKIGNFDINLGLGWGRLSERATFNNPLGYIDDDYKKRGSGGGEKGGKLRLSSFYTGESVGIFGGIAYEFSKKNLKFVIEYNSDSYEREKKLFTINESSPLSYGIEWKTPYNFDFMLSYQQKNQIAFSVNSGLDTKKLLPQKKILPFYSSLDNSALKKSEENLSLNNWYDRLFFDLDKSGVLLRSAKIYYETKQADLEISNMGYALTGDAINRALVLAQIHLPRFVKNINLIVNENGIRVKTISYFRGNNASGNIYTNINRIRILNPRIIEDPLFKTTFRVPHLHINADLASRFQLFDPEKPTKYQIFLKFTSIVTLGEDLNLIGTYALNVKNNFDTQIPAISALPHVRTDINQYLTKGATGINSLLIEKKSSLSTNIHYRAYAGILEDMYSGFGGEILYMPLKTRWAVGATLNSVRKRDFKKNFQMLDYKTTTGFLSVYYASPFYNYDFAMHLGKYLAKDKGATFEIRRTFDNGYSIGAFATFTDVSSSDYGEGSFDKGLFFKIPFNSFLKNNSKNTFSTLLRSVQRDGGQKLDDYTGVLWHELRNVRYDSFNKNINRMLPK